MVADGRDTLNDSWGKIWKMEVPPKIKVFYWRLCKGWLAVKEKLRRWGLGNSSLCPICENGTESIWHLFVDCEFAKKCWQLVGLWSEIDAEVYLVEGHGDLFLRLLDKLNPTQGEKLMMIAWQLWNHRNDMVWRDNISTPALAVHKAISFHAEWKMVRSPAHRQPTSGHCRRWHKPPVNGFKINVDAGFFTDSLQTGIGMILRNDAGAFVACKTTVRQGLMRVDEGEGWGVLEALQWAEQLNLNRVVIETDAKIVRDALLAAVQDRSSFGDYIHSARCILRNNNNIDVKLISRDANMVAHTLARSSRSFESPSTWVEPPTIVDGLLDVLCFSCD